jgi:HD-GYP domain-containing protein (c-di-GMP phosphodiesterase class II)
MVLEWEQLNGFSAMHSQRTSDYALKLAQAIGRPEHECALIQMASLLHDVGKVEICEAVWRKPTFLTNAEFEMVRSHATAGEKLCASIGQLAPALSWIRHHHERYDGTGYPDGLVGEQIPLGARIISVADAFAALTSDRPYRKAYFPDEAVEILRGEAGLTWDPALVEAFCDLITLENPASKPLS